jgi:hypothetical protein
MAETQTLAVTATRKRTAAAGLYESAATARRMAASPTIYQRDAWQREAEALTKHADQLRAEADTLEEQARAIEENDR